MNKFLLFAAILLSPLTSLTSYANERHEIHLNNYGKDRESISILGTSNNEICRIEAVLQEVDDNGFYTIELSIENQSDSYVMFLFGKDYTRRELRIKIRPSVVYAKGFVEAYTQTSRLLMGEGRDYVRIMPEEGETFEIQGKEGDSSFEYTLPLYFAKPKGCLWKRHSLLDCNRIDLSFSVDISPSATYTTLKKSVDEMLDTLAKTKYVVCKHGGKRHHPDLEEQMDKTRMAVNSLSQKIEDEMKKVQFESKRYKELKSLQMRLVVDLDKIAVENCPHPGTKCSCSPQIERMTLKQIYDRLESLCVDMKNGKTLTREAKKEAKALKTHSSHISRDPENYKKGIERYYNEMMK